jgi:CRISPR-associated endonuclease Cas2
MLYVVSYRMADAAGRVRVQRVLKAYGWEVAPGLFECPVGPAQAGELRGRLERVVGEADQVRMYQVCEGCLSRSWRHGGQEWSEKPSTWVF